jgi:hypothetical protein
MSKRPVYIPTTLILAIILLNSCTTGRVYISVLQPASVNIPGSIKSVSIFPAAGIPDKHGIFDSIRYAALDTAYDYNITRKGYIYGLFDVLSHSPRFSKIVIADSVYGRAVSSGVITWDFLKKICRHDTTDAILLLKKAVAYDTLMSDPDVPVSYDAFGTVCNFNYRVIHYTRWAFYEPEDLVQTETLTFSDTVYFYETGGCNRIHSPAAMRNVLYSACFYSGSQVARELAPAWEDHVRRIFFTGPNFPLKTAAEAVMKDHWEEAGSIWEALAVNSGKRLAYKAAFNTALAWEREDDLDQAWLWINFADSLVSNKKTETYKDLLSRRVHERTLLDQQLSGDEIKF